MVKKEARGWGRPPEEINGHARLPRYMEVLAGKSMRYGGPETLWNHQYGRDGPEAVVVLDAANQKPQCLKLIQEGLHAAFNGDHIESERLLKDAVTEDPDSNPAHFYLGVLLDYNGWPRQALREYEAALRLDPEDRFARVLVESRRSHSVGSTRHLYQDECHIAAFRGIMENPSSQNMHAISTRAITSHIGDMTSARVMDVGIGDGSQMLQVIQELAEGGSRLQELEVLGLDPNASMLELATEALTGQSTQSTGIDVSFTPLNHTLMKLRLGRLGHVDVVTSTIAFHHMPRDQKAKQLEKIRDLTPGLLVISDADTHHDIDLLKGDPRLVYNARTFYGTLFDMLKTKLPPDRAAELFDRFLTDGDIKNILTLPTRKRMEYHMSAIRWLNMLEGTGYEIIPPQPEHISGLEGASIVESDGRGYANAWRQNGKNMQFVIQAKPQR